MADGAAQRKGRRGGGSGPSRRPSDLPYRPCVGIVLMNDDRRIFVGRRKDLPGAWQMPQGGIDPGEPPRDAAFRELYEETNVERAELVAESREWIRYDLPESLLGRAWRGRYRGQEMKWFLMRFLGTDADIDLHAHTPEFDEWRWFTPDEVLASIVEFKRPVYERVIAEFRDWFQGTAGPR